MSEPRALEVLRRVFGYESFRGEQQAIVDHVIQGGDALVLMPTGGGKSLCYQVPALVREGTGVVAIAADRADAGSGRCADRTGRARRLSEFHRRIGASRATSNAPSWTASSICSTWRPNAC